MAEPHLKRATDQMLASLRPTVGTFEGAIKVDIPEGIMMNSYPGPYGQVLTNLFLNAVTHGLDETKGGRITVNARQLNDEQVEINFSCGYRRHRATGPGLRGTGSGRGPI